MSRDENRINFERMQDSGMREEQEGEVRENEEEEVEENALHLSVKKILQDDLALVLCFSLSEKNEVYRARISHKCMICAQIQYYHTYHYNSNVNLWCFSTNTRFLHKCEILAQNHDFCENTIIITSQATPA